jgi:carbonic anhydrase/acetyltransferase-like protein (isoleucine patch superfamily)
VVIALATFFLTVAIGVIASTTCSPTSGNRPVCPGSAKEPFETASFIDPTVTISDPARVTLGEKVFIGPFAELLLGPGGDDDDNGGAKIQIGEESNLQDNVTVIANVGGDKDDDNDDDDDDDDDDDKASMRAKDDDDDNGSAGVTIGERVILAHGSTVKGLAQIGVQGRQITFPSSEINNSNAETFIAFSAEVDGATIEKNTVLQPLSRVGPGIRLPAGSVVLPGKNIASPADVTNPDKVVPLTEATVELMEEIIEVNTEFAKEYSRIAKENINNVKGISIDPDTSFNPGKDMPKFDTNSPGGGKTLTTPNFRNRIIGAVLLENTFDQINTLLGNRIALRADEGKPFTVGTIKRMQNNVVFHSLKDHNLTTGDNVFYGDSVIVHGGPQQPPVGSFETIVGDDVTIENDAVLFRAVVGNRAIIGAKSAIINSTVDPDGVIAPRTVLLNNLVLPGGVEW